VRIVLLEVLNELPYVCACVYIYIYMLIVSSQIVSEAICITSITDVCHDISVNIMIS
jgi:hypothetical protein